MIRGVGRVPLKMCIRISVKGKLGHSSVNKKRASLKRAFLRSFYQHDHILGLKSWSLSHKRRLDERDMMMLLYFQKFFLAKQPAGWEKRSDRMFYEFKGD